MQHVIVLRLLRQCVLLKLAEGRGLDANQSTNFNGALLGVACDFCLIGREAVARGDFDARRESALATREVTRKQCAEVQERRQKLLAEAATKAPFFVHASQVAAEAATAATAAAAAETGAGSSSDGGARHDAASRGGAGAGVSTEASKCRRFSA